MAATIAALAAGSLSFAKLHAHDLHTLEQTEKTLEKEISRENKAPPTGSVARVRHHGERLLHSKYVLLAVVILNIIDCILVMGELILDIHYIVNVLEKSENLSSNFMFRMESKYPVELAAVEDISQLYDNILLSSIHWNISNDNLVYFTMNVSDIEYHHRTRRSASKSGNKLSMNTSNMHHHKEHSLEEDIAHGFHKASITILAILVLETIFKIFCFGKHMLENKLEVFDSIIVVASFVLDLVFIKGLTVYSIQEFVFILAFLVPWRVLRVVNSLIVAIIDHEHFRMKLLYKQKKQILVQLKEAKKDLKLYENSVQCLEQLCSSSGIPELKTRTCTAGLKSRKKKQSSAESFSKTGSFEDDEITTMMLDKDDNENKNGTVSFQLP